MLRGRPRAVSQSAAPTVEFAEVAGPAPVDVLGTARRRTSARWRALQAWLESARIVDGPVFRSLDTFQRVTEQAAVG